LAVWQFDSILVPHEALAERFGHDALTKPIGWLPEAERDHDWWADRQPPPGYLDGLDALLPRYDETVDCIRWGVEDGDRVDALLEEGRLEELLVRIDLRDPNQDFIAGITKFAAALRCDVLTLDGSVGEADAPTLATLIQASRAMRFVQDPVAFLRRVAIGGYEDA
jgi:hypothetical protein